MKLPAPDDCRAPSSGWDVSIKMIPVTANKTITRLKMISAVLFFLLKRELYDKRISFGTLKIFAGLVIGTKEACGTEYQGIFLAEFCLS